MCQTGPEAEGRRRTVRNRSGLFRKQLVASSILAVGSRFTLEVLARSARSHPSGVNAEARPRGQFQIMSMCALATRHAVALVMASAVLASGFHSIYPPSPATSP